MRVEGTPVEAAQGASLAFFDCDVEGLSLADRRLSLRLVDCQLDLASLRMAKLTRCELRGCSLRETDLFSATLESLLLTGCDLTGADVSRAEFTRSEIEGCELEGLRGVEALRAPGVWPEHPGSGPSVAGQTPPARAWPRGAR